MKEPLPLATVQEAILDFCRGRTDVCVFGAQAVVHLMADDPERTARELVKHLAEVFPNQMAARVRAVRREDRVLGYRVYQRRGKDRGGNRHLADVRVLDVPRARIVSIGGVQYTDGPLTLAMKVHAATVRSNLAKKLQDQADVVRLITAMPQTRLDELEPLWAKLGSPASARETFEQLRAGALAHPPTDEDEFY
jgi:hypothetical protein